jgi:hypothetical protein
MKRLKSLRPAACVALGLFLGHGAQAETILDFEIRPSGQGNNATILQTFGDNAAASTDGITVSGFGTPNINLTWQATGGRWDYYGDSVWTAGQLDSSQIGDLHELVFSPNNPAAAAVINSFNFHPYYVSNERFAYDVTVLTNSVVASGPAKVNFLSEGFKVPVSINYTGVIGQTLTLRLTRVASSPAEGEIEGSGADIAVDDIAFAQQPETEFAVGPQVVTVSPGNGQFGVAPDYFYRAAITNLTTAVATNTIQLKFNGSNVAPAPTITEEGGLTIVSYEHAGLLPGGSTNRYRLTYNDDSVPTKSYTNDVQYIAATYVDIQLPAPIVFENFDATPEGNLPAGWSAINLDTQRDPSSEPDITLSNLDSAAYTNWTVVDAARFTGTLDTYSQVYNGLTQPAAEAEDYQRVLGVNPSNVVNGVFQRRLATGGFALGNSGYRKEALGQIVYLFSPDFDLTDKTNVYLSFHSLWEQNQDSIAAVEYSIDRGANWLPIVYMLDGADVATNLDGTIDALTTFTNLQADAAYYVDAATGTTEGGFYGAFIGVASNQWSTLAPNISKRVDDNPVESKRVELFRLAQADHQPKVRLRFAHAGRDSWYFGIDDVGFYSLPPLMITNIVRSGSNLTVSWKGAGGTKLQRTSNLISPNWQDVPGSNGAGTASEPAAGEGAYFRLVRPY